MSSSRFYFRNFWIENAPGVMPLTTDSVLLGVWSAHHGSCFRKVSRILDMGSGTGAVSFFLAQRFPDARVCGWDVHEPSVLLANRTAEQPFFGHRVSFHCADLAELVSCPEQKGGSVDTYDLIVSNPPYYETGMRSCVEDRDRARSTYSFGLTPSVLFSFAYRYLAPMGCFSLITPISSLPKLRLAAAEHLFYPTRICRVSNSTHSEPIRLLSEWMSSSSVSMGSTKESSLSLFDAEGQCTPEYQALRAPFYRDSAEPSE